MSDASLSRNTRRALLLAAGGALGVAFWRRHDLAARLFNPFSADRFDLPPLPGLLDAEGAPVQGFSAQDLTGRAVFLNAFASWCPQCRAEHAALLEFAHSGAIIYGVASLDDPARTLEFLRREGNPFARVGVDRNGYLYRALGARGVPASFVMAPAPHLALKLEGPLDVALMRAQIQPLLDQDKA